jgi:dipeptidase E
MCKILLTSAGFENPIVGNEFLNLVNKTPSTIKILFIPTASRTEEELYYVEKSKEELLSIGIEEKNIITFNLDYNLSEEELNKIDVIYICGGNTFYLLHRVRETKFDKVIMDFVSSGKVYVGVSAGSLLAGPNIKVKDLYKDNDIGIKDFRGLNITDITVIPHYTEEAKEKIQEIKEDSKYEIITLTDSQALLIIDSDIKIIE